MNEPHHAFLPCEDQESRANNGSGAYADVALARPPHDGHPEPHRDDSSGPGEQLSAVSRVLRHTVRDELAEEALPVRRHACAGGSRACDTGDVHA